MRVKVLKMWKVDINSEFNIVLIDCQNKEEIILYTDADSEDSPVDIAVQYLNRQGVMINYYSVDLDHSVVLLAD